MRLSRCVKASNTLVINEAYRPWLTQMGLLTFERLMFGDIGCVVEKKKKRDIRRIEGGGRAAYLKRRLTCSTLKSIEMYLCGGYAYTAPFAEYLHVCALQRFQFPVMNWIAAGEQRKAGFPCLGFILVDEVTGKRLDELLTTAQTQVNEASLLRSYGRLLANLHRHGFYHALRLKDIIVSGTDEASLVIIDRESRHPYPRCRSKRRALNSLSTSFRRIKRDLPAFNDSHMNIVMQSYRDYSDTEHHV